MYSGSAGRSAPIAHTGSHATSASGAFAAASCAADSDTASRSVPRVRSPMHSSGWMP